jgi:hypothetical protein
MEWKLTPVAQQKLIVLTDFQLRVQRLHGLVEQYATIRTNPALLEAPIRRAAEQLKISFMGAGYGPMAQMAGSIAIALRRGGAVQGKARVLREAVGTLRAQLDSEQRATAAEGKVSRNVQADAE